MRTRYYRLLILTSALSLALPGCLPRFPTGVQEVTASPQVEEIALPAPRVKGEMSLEETLAARRSVREFTEEELTLEEISQLLWAVQGMTAAWGGRTAPSAGALYPLEVYAATADGLYRYLPQGHKAIVESRADLRGELWRAGLSQDAIREAPAVFVMTAVYARTEKKYGGRAERYVKLEAGHAAQNLLLQAVALGLGGVPIGAFYDDQVQSALSLPSDYEPLYLIPIGHPRE
ncbi:MAG: SagB/ThcOx family dehydrogenase [Anaerolineae bacterium]